MEKDSAQILSPYLSLRPSKFKQFLYASKLDVRDAGRRER